MIVAITGPIKGSSREKFIKSKVQNPYNNGHGIGNSDIFLK